MKTTDNSSAESPVSGAGDAKPDTHVHQATPDSDRIARRAYELWDQEGRPDDKATEHWSRAEREIRDQPAAMKPAYAKVEELAKQAYGNSDQAARTSEQKKHWLEVEADMREREKPHPVPPSKAPPPEERIEPIEPKRPASKK